MTTATEPDVADTWRAFPDDSGSAPLRLEQKSVRAAPAAGGLVDSSDDGYEHTVIVSVTGVVDAVNDVPVPGCYTSTLKKRLPKQIANHDWGRPQGRYLWMKELLPGDPGLPKTTPKGDPWPAEAGALIGRVRLFQGTREGDEAKVRWKEYGPDLQLSIGYQVKRATRDPRRGTRYLHDLDLYENSEVLWGSSPISGPMPAALAVKVLAGYAMETKDVGQGDEPIAPEGVTPVDVAGMHVAADEEIDWEEVAEAAELAPDDLELGAADHDGEEGNEEEEAKDEGADVEEGAEGKPATERLDPALIADATELGVEIQTKAAPKKKPQTPAQRAQEQQGGSQDNNSDFNSKHPRGGKGSAAGGKFVRKGSGGGGGGDAVAAGRDLNKDGLPDNWLAMIKAGDKRYAAYDAAHAKKGKKKKGRDRQAEKARAGKLAGRANEMDRRDRVDAAREKEQQVEENRRVAADARIASIGTVEERTKAKAAEAARRKAWTSGQRQQRVREMQHRRDWESQQRHATANAATAKAEKKTLPVGDVDAPHAYVPSDEGTECEDCDLSAATPGVHTDADSVLTGLAWAEEQAWTGDPLEVKAEGGADKNRGNAERLRRWYLHEAGIPWGSPGDWAACVAIAGKHMRPDQAKGYCNLRHKDATGEYAGPKAHGGGVEKAVTAGRKDGQPDDLEHGDLLTGDGTGTALPPIEDNEGKLLTWEPDAEVGDQAAWRPVETKRADLPAEPMPGTMEERRELVRAAVHDRLSGEKDDKGRCEWDSVTLLATFADRAIARRFKWRDGSDNEETYEIPYEFTEAGAVELGEPQQVTVRAVVERTDRPEPGEPSEPPESEHPAVGLVEDAAYAVKTLGARALEIKAGRVLSRVNEQRLRDAIMHLLAVCGVAGVEVDLPSKAQVDDAQGLQGGKAPEPTYMPDTTSREARETKTDPADSGVMRLSPAEVAEAMAMLLPWEVSS